MKRIVSHATTAGLAALLFACGGEQKTQPQDASAAEHRAMAEQEEQSATAHEAAERQAAGPHGSQTETPSGQPCGLGGCWTSMTSPPEQDQRDVERHRELAQEHRAASSALISVSVITEPVRLGKQVGKRTAGARIEFRAVPGMTGEWLQSVVDCHLARAAALGHDIPEVAYCPLVPKGVRAKVHSVGNGFAVDVTSDDHDTVAEVVRRAEALK